MEHRFSIGIYTQKSCRKKKVYLQIENSHIYRVLFWSLFAFRNGQLGKCNVVPLSSSHPMFLALIFPVGRLLFHCYCRFVPVPQQSGSGNVLPPVVQWLQNRADISVLLSMSSRSSTARALALAAKGGCSEADDNSLKASINLSNLLRSAFRGN